MKPEQTKKIIDIYLEGKLTEAERSRLETWYLLQAEDAKPAVINDYDLKEKKMWAVISGVIAAPDSLKKKGSPFITLTKMVRIGVAAALLIAGGLGINYLVNQSGKTEVIAEGSHDIAAGGNKAILTLSNGSKIDLSGGRSGVIAEESGVNISKSPNGELIYTLRESAAKDNGFNTIETPSGGQYIVVLPDGSKVYLNAVSQLRYPTALDRKSRNVTLQGEGYFEVSHQREKLSGKRIPFTVNIIRDGQQMQTIKVLGTHFNVNGYDNEPAVKTILVEGKVAVETKSGSVILRPGEQSLFAGNVLSVSPADTDAAIAWKNGDFALREDLSSVMRKISRWYDVEVIFEKDAPKTLNLGGWISRRKNISEVLKFIQSTDKVHFKLEGRRVTVFK